MEWNQVAEAIFYGLGSLAVLWVGFTFTDLKADLKELTNATVDLTVKIATMIERMDSHEKRISRLEDDR